MDVELHDIEVQDLIKKIEQELDQVDSALDPSALVRSLEQRIKQLNNKIKTMGIEIRSLRGTDEARTFKPKIKEYEKQAKEFEKQLKWARARSQGGGNTVDHEREDRIDAIANDENEAIRYGRDLLNETENAANSALQIVTDTVATAADTSATLHKQTEQIKRMDGVLDETYDELERAERVIKRIARRTLTDKYMWILAGLIVVAIIVVIVLLAVNSNGKIATNSATNVNGIAHPLGEHVWNFVQRHGGGISDSENVQTSISSPFRFLSLFSTRWQKFSSSSFVSNEKVRQKAGQVIASKMARVHPQLLRRMGF